MRGFVKRWLEGPGIGTAPREAFVERGQRVYCVGDVHGRVDLLQELHDMILRDARDFHDRLTVVYLGDLIDRGLHSRDVIELLLNEPLEGFESIYLMGNHERAMLDFLSYPEQAAGWLTWGGRETVLSYGATLPRDFHAPEPEKTRDALLAELPDQHVAFCRNMRLYHSSGDYIFVHAGIRPGVPLKEQSESDLLWIRNEFLASEEDYGCVVVHGHSITERVEERHNRIGIDTGAYRSGVLTCLVLEGQDRRVLQTGNGT